MAAETSGICSSIERVRRVPVETSPVERQALLGELALQGEEALDLVLTQLDAQRESIVPAAPVGLRPG
jgi:hypothetical protein